MIGEDHGGKVPDSLGDHAEKASEKQEVVELVGHDLIHFCTHLSLGWSI